MNRHRESVFSIPFGAQLFERYADLGMTPQNLHILTGSAAAPDGADYLVLQMRQGLLAQSFGGTAGKSSRSFPAAWPARRW